MIPLSRETPKPMMPVWGKPILNHTFDMLEQWNVREVLVNLHHAPRRLVEYVRARDPARLRINLSYEPEILGTGGAIQRAEWFIGNSPFWVVNGDIVADVDPYPFLKAYQRVKPMAVLWLNEVKGPRTVEMIHGTVTNFHTTRPGTTGTYTFCGLQLVSPRITEHLRPGISSSIIDAYSQAMKCGHLVAGVCVPGAFWADIGTPTTYLEAHRDILQQYRNNLPGRRLFIPQQLKRVSHLKQSGITVDGFLSLGRNIRIGPGTSISNSVIWDEAVITANSRVENAIIGQGAKIRGRVNRMALCADTMGDVNLVSAIEKLGWPLKNTTALPFDHRGSERTFTRIQHGARSAIMIQYSLTREENALYVQNARFLKKVGVRVPEILLDIPDKHLTIMEDVGDCSLLDCVEGKSPQVLRGMYHKVLDTLLVLHRKGTRFTLTYPLKLQEPFSRKLYQLEHELFTRHFLANRLSLKKQTISKILADLTHVSDHLLKEPLVLIHRDMQSTNVLFRNGHPVFLDFQGMRFGPVVYDIASLLCDPYVSLPAQIQDSLVSYYARRIRSPEDIFRKVFWWAAVQRLVQAIGAYAKLSANRETEQFGRYIEPALKMMHRALGHVEKLPHLKKLVCHT